MLRLISLAFAASTLFAAAGEFNGRWNLTVEREPRNRAWWLEVTDAGTPAIKGRFVGAPGGQLDPIPEIRLDGDELVWIFRRPYRPAENNPNPPRQKGVYRAKLHDGLLKGSFEVENNPASKLLFTGKRAPLLKEVDDGNWKEGAPVSLLNGKDLGGWFSRVPGRQLTWYIENGHLKNGERAVDIVSEKKFWNFKLHVEYKVADRSNSGIGLRGRYEVQIYGDYGRPPSSHGNGALYSRIVPAVNATLPADQWQTFDITLIGRQVSVVLNGKTLIDKQEIEGLTAMAHDPNEDQPGPISLQGDHGPVEFRKIVVIPLTR
jgi:hypothetical protein